MSQMLQQETITRLALQCSQRLKRQRTAKLFFQCTVLVFERCWDFSILDENRGVFEKDRPEDEMMSWAGNELFAARQDSILEQMGAPWVKRQLLIRFTIRCVELWTFAFLFKDKAINICCPGTGTSIKTHLAVSPGSSRLWVTGSKLAEVVFWKLSSKMRRQLTIYSKWILLQGLCTQVDLPQSDHLCRSLLLPLHSLPLRPHPVGEGEAGSLTTSLDRYKHFLHQGSIDVETNIFNVKVFELLCIYADRFQSYIPLNFLIGFYVQQVFSFPTFQTWVVHSLGKRAPNKS